jgi:UDP-N-acetylmuramate-alanine ligase
MSQLGDYFFCGVGGSGMTPLALIIQSRGGRVEGSDRALDQGRNAKRFDFHEPVYFGGTVDRSVGSEDIVREIQRCGRKAFAFQDRGACGDMLVRLARSGDRIVVMGARDDSLSQFAYELLRRLAVTKDEGSIATP